MEETYILGYSQAARNIGQYFIEIPRLNNDIEIHNWIIRMFQDRNIQKLVIEVGDDPVLSLKIGYHIRLSLDDLREQTLISILFISNLSLNTVIMKGGIYSQILATDGVYFSEFESVDIINNEVNNIEPLSADKYLTTFLRIIHVLPEETTGRHSLANIWGAYAMDSAANTKVLSLAADFRKKLYYKYLSAYNKLKKLEPTPLNIIGHIPVGTANRINAEGKRVLLIDDEADTGWKSVLQKVFKVSRPDDFVAINEKVSNYDSFTEDSKKIIETEDFDLYLVDLRLNGSDEDDNTKTDDFSGFEVLKKIKSINQGRQVIMFTASNKSWNLKILLESGADDYYLKESPEYKFSTKQSELNYTRFKEGVEKCLDKSYLRTIYAQWRDTESASGNPDQNLIQVSNTSLEMAWKLIKNNFLDFGFMTLFQIIETFADESFEYDKNSGGGWVNGTAVIEKLNDEDEEWLLSFKKDKVNGHYFGPGIESKAINLRPTSLFKASCLLKFKYNKNDEFLRNFGRINKLRNDIAHGGSNSSIAEENLIEILKIIEEFRSR